MKTEITLLGIILTIAAMVMAFIALTSCGVVYKGKYGKYTATPNGVVIIEPYYAK